MVGQGAWSYTHPESFVNRTSRMSYRRRSEALPVAYTPERRHLQILDVG